MAIAFDATTPTHVATEGTASTTLTTGSFTPAANSLLVVIFQSTGASRAGATSITDSGPNLNYGSPLATQSGTDGASEVYLADVGGSPVSMTVTANFASAQWVGLKVVVVTGAAVKASQNGGTATNHSASGTPSLTIATLVGTNSLIIGGFTQNTNTTTNTVPAGQSTTIFGDEMWDSTDVNWYQYLTGMNLAAGASATVNITAPTSVEWSGAILEVLAGAPVHSMTAGTVSEADTANAAVFTQGGGAITTGQIEYHYSGSGTPANPELSLGGTMAAGTVTSGATNNVWKDVTDAERQSGKDYYSCLYVKNTNPATMWKTVTLWIDDPEDQGTTSIGLDPQPIGGTATTIANVNTAPTGVTFGSPTTKGAGTVIGDIPAGSWKSFWEKRSFPAAGTASASDTISVRCEGDTTTY